jgi:hypothetical protein
MNDIVVNTETLMFKILCEIFEAQPEVVAKTLSDMPDEQSDDLIEMVFQAETEDQIEKARQLFREALM